MCGLAVSTVPRETMASSCSGRRTSRACRTRCGETATASPACRGEAWRLRCRRLLGQTDSYLGPRALEGRLELHGPPGHGHLSDLLRGSGTIGLAYERYWVLSTEYRVLSTLYRTLCLLLRPSAPHLLFRERMDRPARLGPGSGLEHRLGQEKVPLGGDLDVR